MAFINTDRLSNILSNMEENTSNLKYAIKNNISEILKKETNNEIELLKEEIRALKARVTVEPRNAEIEKYKENTETSKEVEELREELKKEKEKYRKYKEWAEKKIKSQMNNLLELKGTIRVITRIKPFNSTEKVLFTDEMIEIPHKSFTSYCNKVFSPVTTQKKVFSEIEDLVYSVTQGYNVSILAYGPTGSGKTYTMEGKSELSCSKKLFVVGSGISGFCSECECNSCIEKGVVYRSADVLSKELKRLEGFGYTHQVKITGVELYNDKVIKSVESMGVDEIEKVFKNVSSGRKISSTECNQRSSRSHLILTINITIRKETDRTMEYIEGSLCIVDLAGSERLNHSLAEGDRMKEAVEINKSLSALGDVVYAISNNTPHIPYRNSKLTTMLKSTLGSGAKTAFIINVDPGSSIDETITALRFCNRLQECKLGKAKVTSVEIVK
ncbi:kinesin family member C2/C3 [Nematocida sp. AWRm78]|nr:kinesin family member C2/C3 [Nematocida sp. AWRm78]